MIDRRTLLTRIAAMGLVGTLATGSVLPRPKEADEPLDDSPRAVWRRAELAAAWRRAAAAGKPLLVIVIPKDEELRWHVAGLWGEVITHGSDKAIAALAAAELVCATQAEIAALSPDYAPQRTEPTLVRLDVASVPVRSRALQVSIPRVDAAAAKRRAAALEEARSAGFDWWGMPTPEDLEIDANIAGMEEMILAAIQPTEASLAADLKALRRGPITGSRWKSSQGCGSQPETPDPLLEEDASMLVMVGCGMGHVNWRSARFLDFLTEPLQSP